MQIYGVDTEGIGGVLIRFSAVVEANKSGRSMLGLAQSVVREGCERAVKAIDQLDGNWDLSNFRITIHLSPAETPKHSAGLDLPIAITLLVGSFRMRIKSKYVSVSFVMKLRKNLVRKAEKILAVSF